MYSPPPVAAPVSSRSPSNPPSIKKMHVNIMESRGGSEGGLAATDDLEDTGAASGGEEYRAAALLMAPIHCIMPITLLWRGPETH